MPQMAPINWLSLLMIFSIILVIVSILNYSLQYLFPSNYMTNKIHNLKNWKW
uniref:ATP synthase complex subunit 8 n=1 Tax=Pseudorhaetus sinicus TaxID=618541 RepID=A0A3G1C9C0_9SCAR|nr:ATP synthase F0 subunit 8 [Pseudorhaetus sinicus]